MRLLLDTHILLWILADDPKLSDSAREMLQIPASNVFYSVASLWEIGIKHGIGKLPVSPRRVGQSLNLSGFSRLAITDDHLEGIGQLPHHHRDPFDRMLVAQAEEEPMAFVTADRRLAVYGPVVRLV